MSFSPESLHGLPAPPLTELVGTWHIVQTNFPMWLKGDKRSPQLHYSTLDRPDQLGDRVTYRSRSGAEKQILGVDTQDPALPAHFTWRGRGLLSLLRSEWYVVHQNAGVMAIYFTPTLFTPAGMDIVARDPDPDAIDAARSAAMALPGLDAHIATLVTLEP